MSAHLMTLVVPVFQGGPSLQGDLFQGLLGLLWDLAIQEVLGHLDGEEIVNKLHGDHSMSHSMCYLLTQEAATTENHML